MALLAACSDSQPAPLPVEEFAGTRAASICTGAASRCSEAGVPGIDETRCTAIFAASYQSMLDEDLARPNATYDPIAAARCARTSRVSFRQDDLYTDSDLLQCLLVVRGLGVDDPMSMHMLCDDDTACAPGYSCYHGIDGNLTPHGWCKQTAAHSEAGMACNATRFDSGSRIIYGWSEDAAACYESDGLYCSGAENGDRRCAPLVALGADCSNQPCVHGAVCRCTTPACTAHTCQQPAMRGDLCTSNGDCVDGLRCDAPIAVSATGTCQAKLPDGAACLDRTDCASGYCPSATGVCVSSTRADCNVISDELSR